MFSVALSVLFPAIFATSRYNVEKVNVPVPGYELRDAVAVTDDGVVLCSAVGDSDRQATIRVRGDRTAGYRLPWVSKFSTTGANNHGATVGTAIGGGSIPSYGFVRNSEGGLQKVYYPQSVLTQVRGINDAGTIVGAFRDGSGRTFGMVGRPDRLSQYLYPGSVKTELTDINDSGLFVGMATMPSGKSVAFVGTRAYARPIDIPEATQVSANAINNRGQVAGGYLDRTGHWHGFILTGQEIDRIEFRDWPDVPATGGLLLADSLGTMLLDLNNRGVAVGVAVATYLNEDQRTQIVHTVPIVARPSGMVASRARGT